MKDKAKQKAYRAKWYKDNKEHQDAYDRAWHKAHLEVKKAAAIKYKYGLTLEQVDQMLIEQDHKCAICGRLLEETRRVIDHDHVTNKVRGILCQHCNIGLWSLENEDYRVKATEYLAKYK
jgi:DNA-directed RNA polymerase subunit RPC12/RpoP